MSHVNQDDGITYADGDEEYQYTGYITMKLTVSFTSQYDEGSDEFLSDLSDSLDICEGSIEDWDLDVEIVKREWRD